MKLTNTSATTEIKSTNSPSIDAFGRWRVSEPFTLFDSKQIHDSQPLFWDDQEVSGTGTGTTYNTNQASTSISVGATTAGKRVRQTFQRVNYQPGKSQLVFLTFSELDSDTGITKEVGYFDDDNGLFLRSAEGTVSVVRKTNTSSTPVDDVVAQSSWNLDKMDGTGASGVTLDFSKTQIAVIDFEWLGVGRARIGWVVDGIIIYCHEFNNANNLSVVYMSTPNLPVRYSIENDGTGASDSFVHICSSVQSESGIERNGILRHADSGVISSITTSKTALIGIQLQSTKLDGIVDIESISIAVTSTNKLAHWELVYQPTVAGTFTYNNLTNSVVAIATGAATNTVTGGTSIEGGDVNTSLPSGAIIPNALRIGSAIDGTPTSIVFTVTPDASNTDVRASITWRELS